VALIEGLRTIKKIIEEVLKDEAPVTPAEEVTPWPILYDDGHGLTDDNPNLAFARENKWFVDPRDAR
jgi:hypothetical protein